MHNGISGTVVNINVQVKTEDKVEVWTIQHCHPSLSLMPEAEAVDVVVPEKMQ